MTAVSNDAVTLRETANGADMEIDEGQQSRFWNIWPIRLVAIFVATALAYAGPALAIRPLTARFPAVPAPWITGGLVVVACALTILVYSVLVRLTERRWPSELGARRAMPLFLQGAIIAFVLFCSVYAALFAAHVATFRGWGTSSGLLVVAVISIASGISEEIILRLIEGGVGTLAALIVSAAMFGALHLTDPHANLVAGAAIALEAGILFAAAYALTRSLWFPIGLHAAWNFTEGGIFGAAVSGGKAKGLLNVPLSGPDWLTGGAFGPEASVVAAGVCTAAAIVLLVLTIRRGYWQRIHFSLQAQSWSLAHRAG
jgi:membrane protease YdiL (CAAX protease family)